jgi:hypothetical protein
VRSSVREAFSIAVLTASSSRAVDSRCSGAAMIGWIKEGTGSFVGGLYFVAALPLFSAILTLVLARSLQRPATSAAAAHPVAHS